MLSRVISLAVLVTLQMAPLGALAANSWCSINHPDVLYCDDFDRWCVNPPPEPQTCSSGDVMVGPEPWGYTVMECGGWNLVTEEATSLPYAMKILCQEASDIAHTGAGLVDFCRARFGEDFNGVVGTDLIPLQVEYDFDGGDLGKIVYDNAYFELSWGTRATPQTPTDGITYSSCCGGNPPTAGKPWYTICRQDGAPATCPPLSTASHTNGIAVGAVAYLDKNPCHCELSRHGPTNDRLSYYDGFKWRALGPGIIPGGGSGGGGSFILKNGKNHVRLTIKSSTVKIEHTVNTSEYSWCELPLDYKGPYNTMFMGYTPPCPLWHGTWECSQPQMCEKGVPGGGRVMFDNLAIWGGQGYHGKEACCFPNATCQDTYYLDCITQNGTPAGKGTTCASYVCCPAVIPDHDVDGDVDLQDFGWFQTCLNGDRNGLPTAACKCADLNSDGDVDLLDFTAFWNCLSGPEVVPVANCWH